MELDEHNVAVARQSARAAGLDGIESVVGDASVTDAYHGAVPADLILLCGVFGNIGEIDIANTIDVLPQLSAPQATIIWTRHRHSPDLTPFIRGAFDHAGFDELAFVDSPPFRRRRQTACVSRRNRSRPVYGCSSAPRSTASWLRSRLSASMSGL